MRFSRFTFAIAAVILMVAGQSIAQRRINLPPTGRIVVYFADEDSSDALFSDGQKDTLRALNSDQYRTWIESHYSSAPYRTRNGRKITLHESDLLNIDLSNGRSNMIHDDYLPNATINEPKVGARMSIITWGYNHNVKELAGPQSPYRTPKPSEEKRGWRLFASTSLVSGREVEKKHYFPTLGYARIWGHFVIGGGFGPSTDDVKDFLGASAFAQWKLFGSPVVLEVLTDRDIYLDNVGKYHRQSYSAGAGFNFSNRLSVTGGWSKIDFDTEKESQNTFFVNGKIFF